MPLRNPPRRYNATIYDLQTDHDASISSPRNSHSLQLWFLRHVVNVRHGDQRGGLQIGSLVFLVKRE